MPHPNKESIASGWEWEDPLDAYKEAHDPYEEDSAYSRVWRTYKVVVSPKSPTRRFHRSDFEVAQLFESLAGEWREATAIRRRTSSASY